MPMIETLTGEAVAVKVKDATAVLDFYQESCAPCRTLTPRLERLAREYAGRVPVYRIDLDRDMAVAKRFGVTSLPTVLFFDHGRKVARLDGLITDRELRAAFDRATGLPGMTNRHRWNASGLTLVHTLGFRL